MSATPLRVQVLRRQLSDQSPTNRKSALSAITRLGVKDAGADVLALLDREEDPAIRAACAITLGRLKYFPARSRLKHYLTVKRDTPDVLAWIAWAFGEIATTRDDRFLATQLEHAPSGDLGRAIGGAYRKTRLESVRAPRSQVLRKLNRPSTRNPRIIEILMKMEGLDTTSYEGLQKAVRLRKDIASIDREYLVKYLDWKRLVPVFEKAINDKRYVYDDVAS
jgi:hypothetical protein